MGKHNIVIPKGVVCDKCNNETLSALDQALIEFKPISGMKTLFGIPSKTGALPTVKFGNARLEMLATGNVRFDSRDPKAFQLEQLEDGTNRMKFNWQLDMHRPSAKYSRKLTRALLKMLLGCIYMDRGHDFALSDRFDPMRDKILNRTKFKGYLAIMNKVRDPSSQESGVAYKFIRGEEGEESVWVMFQFYGVIMVTDSEMLGLNYIERLDPDRVGVIRF